MGRRHRRSKVTRVVNLVKKIIAFFFSHIGLCALVSVVLLLYFIFYLPGSGLCHAGSSHLPSGRRAPRGNGTADALSSLSVDLFQIQSEVTAARHKAVDVMWNATFRVNKLDEQQWKQTVYNEVATERDWLADYVLF